MRGNKRNQVLREERKALQQKRAAESTARKVKRKENNNAVEMANAAQRSPARKKVATAMKAKRGAAQEKEQANHRKSETRAAVRLGGRKKQVQSEFEATPEEGSV